MGPGEAVAARRTVAAVTCVREESRVCLRSPTSVHSHSQESRTGTARLREAAPLGPLTLPACTLPAIAAAAAAAAVGRGSGIRPSTVEGALQRRMTPLTFFPNCLLSFLNERQRSEIEPLIYSFRVPGVIGLRKNERSERTRERYGGREGVETGLRAPM